MVNENQCKALSTAKVKKNAIYVQTIFEECAKEAHISCTLLSYRADTLVVKLAQSLAYISLVVPVISSHCAGSVPPKECRTADVN